MRPVNLPTGAAREQSAGHVWEEVSSGAPITVELLPQQAFRVRAAAAVTVTIGGVLAMTMALDEIELFNAGTGTSGDGKTKVTVVIAGNAFVQVSRMVELGRRTK